MINLLIKINARCNVFYVGFYCLLVAFSSVTSAASSDLTISGDFSSTTIGSGNINSLTLTLDNQTGGSLSGINFLATIDDPSFMDFAEPSNVSTNCSSGNYSFTATEFSVTDYLLVSGESCYFTLDVTASHTEVDESIEVLGVTVSDLSSSAGAGTNPAGPVQLSIDPNYIRASLAVSNASLSVGSVNTVTVSMANLPLWFGTRYYTPTGTINLPSGVSVASPVNFTTTCGSLVTNSNTAGSSSFVLPFSSFADSTSCEITFDIVASTAGTMELISGGLSNPANGQTIGKISTAYVSQLSFINATFSPTALVPGGTGTIEVSILNTDRANPATNISFADDLDSVLTGLVSTGDLNDVCGTGSSLTGTGLLTFSGGSLAAGASCDFSINVAIPSNAAPNNYINTISAISYELDGSTITPDDALSTFTVNSAPALSISTNQSGTPTTSVAAGDVISVEYVLTNVDGANAASSISMTHELTGLPYFTAAVPADNFCNGSGVATFAPTSNDVYSFVAPSVSFSGLGLAAGASCTFSVDYTVPDDFNAGSYLFSVGAIDATINSIAVQSPAPSASSAFTVDAAPQLTMVFNPGAVAPDSASTIEFKISHGAGSTYNANDISFSLDLDSVLSGMTVQSLPTEPCGVGSVISGTSTLTLASGLLTPDETCEFSVPVAVPANAISGSYTFNSSILTASINGDTLTSALASSDLQVTNVTATKSFSPSTLRVGNVATEITSVYVINNADAIHPVTDISFTEQFNSIYSGVTVTSVNQADVCGTGSLVIVSGSTLILAGGALDPLTSCTFNVTLSLPADMPANVYANTSSAITATVNGNNTVFEAMNAKFTVNEISVLTSIDVSSPTSATSIIMSINFSEDVQEFIESDISVTNATLSNFTVVSASKYTVEVTPQVGIVTLNIAAGVAKDISDATLTNTSAVPISFEYQLAPSSPTPSIAISAPSSLLNDADEITYTVTYTDAETVNLLAGDITFNKTADSNGNDDAHANVSILNGDETTATVVLSGFTGDGALGINIAAETARNNTNLAPAAGPSNVFIVDTHQPTVTLSTSSNNQIDDFRLGIVFEEAVTDFDISDISVTNGTLSDFQADDALNYSVLVSATGETTISLVVVDSVANDSAGNGNSVSNSVTVNYDDIMPTVNITGPVGPVTTGFTATIDFSEVVSNFVEADIQFTNATLSSFSDVNGQQYTVFVTPITQAGVELSIDASIAIDNLGNDNTASNSYSVIYDFNDAPFISGVPATSINEDASYLFSPNYSDADVGDTLTFSIINKPTWATFSAIDGTLSGVPTNDDVGINSGIIISISDGALPVDLAAFDIEVINANDAPTISGVPATTVSEGEVYSFTPSADDIDTGETLTFSIANKPSWATFNSADGTLTGLLANEDVGTTSNIIISVSDGDTSTALAAFSITVENVNDVPTIAGSPSSSVDQDTVYSFIPTANDIDTGDNLTFSIVNKPSWVSFSSVNGSITGTPSNDDVGTSTGIVIAVSDGTVSVPLASFSITVENVNDAPSISGSPSLTVNQDSAYSFTPIANDVDTGDNLAFSIMNKPSWANFSSVNGALTGTPSNDDIGTSTGIIIAVSDGTVTVPLASFSITVENVNDAPSISGSPSLTVNQDSAYSYTPVANDVDSGDNLVFSIINKPSWANFSSVSGALTGTPSNDDIGTSTGIIIAVSDGTVSVPLASFSITVVNVNDAPTISGAPNSKVSEGNTYSFTPIANDIDSGDNLTFSIVNKPNWALFSTADGSLTGTPQTSDIGIATGIVISVSDGELSASLSAFSIEIVNVNEAPMITGLPTIQVEEGQLYEFVPTASDVDVDDVLTFSIVNKPSWASFDTVSGSLTGTPESSDIGITTNIKISVSDGELEASLTIFSIEVVNVNDAPEISGSPQTMVEQGLSYSFMPTATDKDSDPLSFSIVNQPSWASFDSTNGLLSGTPSSSDIGITSAIVITVTDGVESASLSAFNIEVVNVNDAPEISGVAATSVLEDQNYSFTPTVIDSDDNDSLTFSITNKPEWAVFDEQLGLLSGTPDNNDVGVTVGIEISVTDEAGETDSLAPFSIEVINVNDAPVFTSTPVTEVIAEQEYVYQLDAEDVDELYELTYSLVSGPAWLSITSSGLVEGLAPADAIGDIFNVVVAVTDGELDSPVLQEYTLLVIEPGSTELLVDVYFTPAPVAPEQSISLIVELNNTGLTDAEMVSFDVTFSEGLTISSLPSECFNVGALVSCSLDDVITSDVLFSAVVTLLTGNESGFETAKVDVSADNIEQSISSQAQVLVANSLSKNAGELLSSIPMTVGYAADINDDDLVDLITFNQITNQLELRFNDGLGHLTQEEAIAVSSPVTSVLVVDINGDGNADIITTGANKGSNVAYMLDSNQKLLSQELLDAVNADVAMVADFTGMGPQLILAGIYQAEVAIYSGIGSGNTIVEIVNFFDLIELQQLSLEASLISQRSLNKEEETLSVNSELQGTNSISNINVVEIEQVPYLLISNAESAPILAQYTEGEWLSENVDNLPSKVERIIPTELNGNEDIDGFVFHDGQWSLIFDLLSDAPQISSVSFPMASDIVVHDIDDDNVIEILFVTPQGVSIWHYYSSEDIRSGDSVIVGNEIAAVLLLDVDTDGDMDMVTLDAQDGVNLWYLTSAASYGGQEIDISIFAEAPNFPQSDQTGPVEFIISNNSLMESDELELMINADSAVTFSQLPTGCNLNDSGVTCGISQIQPAEQVSIIIWVSTNNTGTYSITGQVTVSDNDFNAENNDITISLLVPEKPKKKSSSGGMMSWWTILLLLMWVLYKQQRRFSIVRR
ncbi:putative Ig domain-containing protein [Shewanella donghaensis]|uniref:putative Ig domain-containing protein n=1 Tax=Shewanella donghaensis TaxID=238836 RepID=UPI001182519A|nr:putative Ig domain-containing protein [Shewanella donghaensis]